MKDVTLVKGFCPICKRAVKSETLGRVCKNCKKEQKHLFGPDCVDFIFFKKGEYKSPHFLTSGQDFSGSKVKINGKVGNIELSLHSSGSFVVFGAGEKTRKLFIEGLSLCDLERIM